MTDRELLERAAKAVGYNEFPGHAAQMIESGWNPLDDDGNAFRLMCDLYMDMVFDPFESDVAARCAYDILADFLGEEYGDDKRSATRRAIVRAAADIAGEETPL